MVRLKNYLYHEILNRFSINQPKSFFELTNNRDKVEGLVIRRSNEKARKQAQNVLKRVRSRVGY